MSEILTVKAVESKTASNGNAFRRIQDQRGRWLSYWHSGEVVVGTTYLAELKSNERNGQTWWQIESLAPAPVAEGTTGNGSVVGGTEKDLNIRRQVALYAAVYHWQHRSGEQAPTNGTVLATANAFLAWLENPAESEMPF